MAITVAKEASPSKSFNYALEYNGFDFALCQSVKVGDIEIQEIAHGDGNKDKYTPGRVKIGEVVMKKVTSEDLPENIMWEKLRSASNSTTGRTGRASRIKETFVVKLLDGDGLPVKIWQIVGAWVKKVSWSELADEKNENFIEEVTWRPDDIKPVPALP